MSVVLCNACLLSIQEIQENFLKTCKKIKKGLLNMIVTWRCIYTPGRKRKIWSIVVAFIREKEYIEGIVKIF